jgi:predicted O-linked N-acetylglucosamine transferase (SPINDLY family)
MFATTGMACYDCLIGDAEVVPPEEERFYRERIVRVPGSYLTFEVGYPVPDVVHRPDGPITFGCLAPLYKITPEVIATWRRILAEVPDSTLILKATALAGEDERRFVRDVFPPGRVRLDGPSDHFEFLKTYDEIDIALDTFPYNGGTTTTEAIWQGVPVVTFWGDRWVARTSASILRAGGLGELVRRDVDDYVAYAIELSHQPARLAERRATMRERLAGSPVCDTPGFARHMERVYFER